MPQEMNPYDEGGRLEPHIWVKDGTATPSGLPRRAEFDDYGRVDFDDDEGHTVVTAWVQKTEKGYMLRVDEHQDVPLVIETSSDRHRRETAMQHLDQQLRTLAANAKHYDFHDDSDPEAFGRAHYEFIDQNEERNKLCITEEYAGTNPGEDIHAVPSTWLYEVEHLHVTPGGDHISTVAGRVGPHEIEQLLEVTRTWIRDCENRGKTAQQSREKFKAEVSQAGSVHALRHALGNQPDSLKAPGTTRPAETNSLAPESPPPQSQVM